MVICSNQPYGQHIVVACEGCGSRHSTKNIGGLGQKNRVYLARSLFDIFGEFCKCPDPTKTGLVHDCSMHDIDFDWETKTFGPIKSSTPS